MVKLTASEASSLLDFMETYFIQGLKDNPDVDSMLWLDNMMTIWRKCGGRKLYSDAEDGECDCKEIFENTADCPCDNCEKMKE